METAGYSSEIASLEEHPPDNDSLGINNEISNRGSHHPQGN
uniref:Uncharacterized protein n=1 Tax=Rhizophora mucronata TaxID=61149 RepID=A0A2P2PXL0_RHIMU